MAQDAKHIETCRLFVKFFDNTVRNIALYPPEHPSVKGLVRRMHELMSDLLLGREEVPLGIVNGILYVDDYLFYEPTPYSDHVLKALSRFHVDDLVFARGVAEAELLALASAFKERETTREAFARSLSAGGASRVVLKSFQVGKPEAGGLPTRGLETYRDAVSAMEGLFGELGAGRLPALREAERVVDALADRMAADSPLLLLLSTVKGYDAYTYQHCVNVGILAMLLASHEGADDRGTHRAALAGLMHDVGKVRVPGSVVNKVGGLTLREWESIKTHPVHSAQVVRAMGGPEDVALAVEGHHLFFGGGGYPVRSDLQRPTDLARLVAVADAYDAITTVRSYKRPMDPVEALKYLESGRGSKFDPRHVDSLAALVGAYPPGVLVRLSSNEVGVVLRKGESPGRPLVRRVIGSDGRRLPKAADLDLGGSEGTGVVVASVADPAVYSLDPAALLA